MKKIFRLVPTAIRERAAFIARAGYYPRFKHPVTYNQKVNHRKLYWKNPLFLTLSDKLMAKEYVRQNFGEEYVIENVFVGSHIDVDDVNKLIEEHGDLVLKANHNSGPVHFVGASSSHVDISTACKSLNSQLKVNYGKQKSESWYSDITPKILAEKKILTKDGNLPWDYKFHVFRGKALDEQAVVLQVDYDRDICHHRSFFDEDLNWLPFSYKRPCLKTSIEKPENYEKMLIMVKQLAYPFSNARVDLYNVDGKILFGEVTFAPGSGRGKFSSIFYDRWMGQLWMGDPAM